MRDIDRDDKTEVAAKCPQCGNLMANMGLDFASPKKADLKKWEHIKSLYSVGVTFHSCGCTGPGYIPNTPDKLAAYFQDLLDAYQKQLTFWRERAEPTNEREIMRENSKHWDYIGQVPYESRMKEGAVSNAEAKSYWFGKIKVVEEKLVLLNKG